MMMEMMMVMMMVMLMEMLMVMVMVMMMIMMMSSSSSLLLLFGVLIDMPLFADPSPSLIEKCQTAPFQADLPNHPSGGGPGVHSVWYPGTMPCLWRCRCYVIGFIDWLGYSAPSHPSIALTCAASPCLAQGADRFGTDVHGAVTTSLDATLLLTKVVLICYSVTLITMVGCGKGA